jgi:hypothetical protein
MQQAMVVREWRGKNLSERVICKADSSVELSVF